MGKSLFTGRIPIQSEIDSITSFKVDVVSNSKRLDLRLIDTTNIFNIYICTITPGDFSVTKREQGIKVDFDKFIRTLIQFFIDVREGNMTAFFSSLNKENLANQRIMKNNDKDNSNIFKFVFIENNTFRNITRLELLFYKPDDREFRRYLSDIITRFEEDNVKLLRESIILKETLQSRDDEIRNIKKEHSIESRELKEKADKFYKENCFLEDENERKNNELLKLEQKMNDDNKKLNDLDYEMEKMKISDLKNKTFAREIEDLKKTIKKIEDEAEEKEKYNRELKDEIRKLKREISEKENKEKDYKYDLEEFKREIEMKNSKKAEYEKKIEDFRNKIIEKDNKIKDLEKQLIDTTRKYEKAQQVYNHFNKKNKNQGMSEKSEDESIISSFFPESPPPK